jgi:hypothetical protein
MKSVQWSVTVMKLRLGAPPDRVPRAKRRDTGPLQESLEWKLTVRWEGFSEKENTDVSFERMFEDVPKFVEEYVRRLVANKSEDADILATLFKDISGNNIKTPVVNSKKRKR